MTEFVTKIVCEEMERFLRALLANWLVRTGIGKNGGDSKKLECDELREKLKGMWGIKQ